MGFLEELMSGGAADEAARPKISYEGEIAVLREAAAQLQTRHAFRPGDIIRAKPQCKLYRRYSDNGLAIVIAVLDEPVVTGEDVGSPFFRMRCDIIIGERDTGNDMFMTYYVDSARFEPIERSSTEGE